MAHVDIGQNSVLNVYANIPCTDGQQVVFQSDSARAAYFNNHRVAQYTGMSYIYHDGVVKVEATPGTMINANYISFNNPSFESKPIYARITDWKYINNATVALTYDVDWFQTFMFDFSFKSSLIEREHLSETDWSAAVSSPWRSDIMELNQDEGIVLNNYDVESTDYKSLEGGTGDYYAAILFAQTSVNYNDSNTSDVNTRIAYLMKSFTDITSSSFTLTKRMVLSAGYTNAPVPTAANILFISLNEVLRNSGTDSTVINTTTYPKLSVGDRVYPALMQLLTGAGLTNQILSIACVTPDQIRQLANGEITKTVSPAVGNSNDPKLKRYPFCYLELMSPTGSTTEYTYEGWMGNTPSFKFQTGYDLTTRTAVPRNYLGKTNNYRERFDTSPMLQIPYTTDNYLTYLSSCYQTTADRYTVAGAISNAYTSASNAINLGLGLSAGVADYTGKTNGASVAMASATNSKQYISAQNSQTNANISAANTAMGLASQAGALLTQATGTDSVNLAASGLRGAGTIFGDTMNTADLCTSRQAHPGSAYYSGSSPSIMATMVSQEYQYCQYYPTDATIELFENYFKAYGYKTGRLGVPRVCNYINASGSMPHWATIDGNACTYVKTKSAKIVAPLKPASDYIKAIFDAGCRFVKG